MQTFKFLKIIILSPRKLHKRKFVKPVTSYSCILCAQYVRMCVVGMGDMGLKILNIKNISGIYCDTDINDDNSGNPVSLEKSISFLFLTPNRVL